MMRAAALLLAVTLALAAGPGARAQDADLTIDRGDSHQAELDAVTRDIQLTEERKAELKREIDALDKDRATLNQALLDAGSAVQKLEGDIGRAEERLKVLLGNEDRLRASLAERRDVLAEVLAALQRMGHRPPPAILVRPQDALASIRSAILLGAVVPDLRVAAAALAGDLRELVAVREEQEKERDRLRQNARALAEGRTRIALIIAERQDQRAASVEALAAEEKRA
jgi:septal ring factor EnvC (AmiA/AmiB activator)